MACGPWSQLLAVLWALLFQWCSWYFPGLIFGIGLYLNTSQVWRLTSSILCSPFLAPKTASSQAAELIKNLQNQCSWVSAVKINRILWIALHLLQKGMTGFKTTQQLAVVGRYLCINLGECSPGPLPLPVQRSGTFYFVTVSCFSCPRNMVTLFFSV